MNKTKILLVEDDLNLGTILREYLVIKGFAVDHAKNGISAFDLYKENKYDLCILDIMLPGIDGFTLARKIRKNDTNTPIIFLTAKSMQDDRNEGLRIGGDDYITKPFSSEELLLRINNIFKRVNSTTGKKQSENLSEIKIGKFRFDYNKRLLTIKDKEQKLTTREADLLKLLSLNKNEVVLRTVALKEIWEDDNYFTARSMDVYIVKLRNYLKSDNSVEIVNIHGTGFKLFA
ncbi:MAG TPA: response regulator transcription factor [Ignavibacteriaceae bacterium]|nr:response regulator transcription factor [Ignavibacteriaceae bacterium]